MNFDDLKDRFLEKWDELKSQLDDSPAWNTAKEKFETLNPNAQKAVIWSVIGLFSLSLFSCPYSYWSESSDYLVEFEDNRDLIRNLLRANQMRSQTASLPPQMGPQALIGQVQNALGSSRLLPEQMSGVNTVSDVSSFGTPLAPPNINQNGVEVTLKKLNLKQVVDLGYRLQNLNNAVKLAGFDVAANTEDDHYFDVVFRLIQFSIQPEAPEAEEDGRSRRRRNEG